MPIKQETHGFISEPIIEGEDYVFGSAYTKLTGEIINPSGNWEQYLPAEELQAPGYETNSCVSFGTSSAIETLKRFVDKVEPNFSDRFISKGSGTNPAQGNTPKAVADFIRKNWSVFENEWPTSAAKNVEEFFADLPAHLFSIAKARGAFFDFGYERVNNDKGSMRSALKTSPLGISVALMPDEIGIYFRPDGWRDGHYVMLYNIKD